MIFLILAASEAVKGIDCMAQQIEIVLISVQRVFPLIKHYGDEHYLDKN